MTELVRTAVNAVARVERRRPAPSAVAAAIAVAAASGLLLSAVVNAWLARRAERRHPPQGSLIDVDGVAVHYVEKGEGDPVVLIHGNGVTAQDWVQSGVFDRLAVSRRVVAFDRPGFGYTGRPRTRIWTARAQANLILGAMRRLGVERATIVGHSWGTLVAMSLALDHPQTVAKLVLMSGYYRPTPRLDIPVMSGPAIPLLGDLVRFSISPLLGFLMAPALFKQMFSPSKVTTDFGLRLPLSMALRPSQIRASAADTALMAPEAARMQARYAELTLPVLVMAGTGDKIVSFKYQSRHLARELVGGILHPIQEAGHMIHHVKPTEVAQAILDFPGV